MQLAMWVWRRLGPRSLVDAHLLALENADKATVSLETSDGHYTCLSSQTLGNIRRRRSANIDGSEIVCRKSCPQARPRAVGSCLMSPVLKQDVDQKGRLQLL